MVLLRMCVVGGCLCVYVSVRVCVYTRERELLRVIMSACMRGVYICANVQGCVCVCACACACVC